MKYGNTTASGSYLVDGWSDAGATVAISVVRTFNDAGSGVANLDVIQIIATVPYSPLVPGLYTFAGLNSFNLVVDHEQAYIGN